LTTAGVDLHGIVLGWSELGQLRLVGPSIMLVYGGTTDHPPWITWLPDGCH